MEAAESEPWETTPLLGRHRGTPLAPAGVAHFPHQSPQQHWDDQQGRLPAQEPSKYDVQYITSILALFEAKGTVFASCSLWLHALGYGLLAAAVCGLAFFGCRRPELIRVGRLCELVEHLSALLGILLVLHLLAALRRWWSLRLGTLGDLSGAVGDLSMLLAAHLPRRGSAELKALVRRYCLASLELTFMQAQGTDGVLGGLVRERLLTDDEKRKLEELVSKPQAMWVWIAGIFQRLAENGKLSSRLLVLFYGICARGRGAVGRGQGAFAYLDTQMPFSYVHFLAVLVHLNSFAVAVKCGILAAVAVWNLRRSEKEGPISDTESVQVLAIQVCFVLGVPTLYHAMLEEAARLSDPLENRFQDSPRRTYNAWLLSECEALQTAGEQPPTEALEVTEAFEVREGDLVHDVVALEDLPQSALLCP